jgi:hypothetical protein
MNYVINVTSGFLPWLYIFKGERLHDDYIKLYKPWTCMAMKKKAWTTSFLSLKIMFFFKRYVLNEISLTNCHLLIHDGHDSMLPSQ